MSSARRALAGLTAAALLAVLPATSLGHATLISSNPAAGANLDTAPAEIVLTFDDELDPTSSSFTVADHHGNEVGRGQVDLDVADRNVMRGQVSISEPGIYSVAYSVAGVDGHDVSGSFEFGYAIDEPASPDGGSHDHEPPNSAVPRRDLPVLVILGVLLVLVAGVAATRGLLVR